MEEKISKASGAVPPGDLHRMKQEDLFGQMEAPNQTSSRHSPHLATRPLNQDGDTVRLVRDRPRSSTVPAEPFGCYVLDKSGSIVSVDAGGAKLARVGRNNLVGSSFFAVVTAESHDTVRSHLAEVVHSGKTAQCEITFNRTDGSAFIARLLTSRVPLSDPDVRLHCVVADVSRQKHLQEMARESEEQYRTIAQHSSDGIAILEDSVVLYANPALCTIFGYQSEAELVGKRLEDLIVDADKEHTAVLRRSSEESDCPPCRFDFRGLRRDRTIVHIEALAAKTSYQGEPAQIIWLRDVGEKIRAEEERRRLALVIEQAAELILVTDRSSTVQYANIAFLRHTGRRREEVMGKPLIDLATHEDDKGFYGTLATKLQRERRWSGRLTLKRQSGGQSEFDVTVSPMRDTAGVATNNVITCRDVTTEAILEEELRQAHKMEAIGTLAGGIAHDFNNILAAIIGNAELALDDLPAESTIHYNLEQIFKASQRAKDLIKQILAFSRRDHQELVPVHVGPLVVETLKLLRSSIPVTIEIQHKIETERDRILADAGRLQQILMNLCSNAAHAMREKGGMLEVIVRECQSEKESSPPVPNLKPGAYVAIEVRDTGHGISKNVMDRIFDPFFTTKRPGEGTGMGLAVVHGIVRSLNGAIAVSSTVNVGSVLTVFLPLAPTGKHEAIQQESARLPGGKEHILFVDDEAPIVEMNAMLLRRLGYRVTPTTRSLEALELFSHTPHAFNLVVSDVTMPELTGVELAKKLRAIREDIPIILVTGYSETVGPEQVQRIGIQELLMKPLVKKELTEAIRKVLDNFHPRALTGDSNGM